MLRNRPLTRLIFAGLTALSISLSAIAADDTPRAAIAKAVLMTEDAEEQAKAVAALADTGSEEVGELLNLWRQGGIFIHDLPDETQIAITLDEGTDEESPRAARRLDNNQPLLDEAGQPVMLVASDLVTADTDSNLRRAMNSVLDLLALSNPDIAARKNAVTKLGMSQKLERLEDLKKRQEKEKVPDVLVALQEAIALIELRSEDVATQTEAARELGGMKSMLSKDFLLALQKEAQAAETPSPELLAAVEKSLRQIETHTKWVNFYGTLFRGLSNGSVLLVVAIGLAITFGLMGVINMAHGELIAVGAYTTYVVQNIFGSGLAIAPFGISIWIPGMNTGGAMYDAYFLVSLPAAFLMAALVGIALERGIIQFLYRRPLESLLATWGVSLVLQQLFKLTFGSNNVQVYSPQWLSGSWVLGDVSFGWNRLFVIGFAIAIIIGTWLLLTKTPLGLLIRAVMQNRQMAACMGVRTERVNMLTFGFGSGLAGLAGAFLSQIGNVGPSLGQSYIVESFMTVVVGGVGSLAGTVIAALGIGVTDQSLQQILLNPVLGKILVLIAIILFLQWRPSGMFVTQSRSLDN